MFVFLLKAALSYMHEVFLLEAALSYMHELIKRPQRAYIFVGGSLSYMHEIIKRNNLSPWLELTDVSRVVAHHSL